MGDSPFMPRAKVPLPTPEAISEKISGHPCPLCGDTAQRELLPFGGHILLCDTPADTGLGLAHWLPRVVVAWVRCNHCGFVAAFDANAYAPAAAPEGA